MKCYSIDCGTRGRRATLRLGWGGGTISDLIVGEEDTGHFFFLTLYNSKYIGEGARAPLLRSSWAPLKIMLYAMSAFALNTLSGTKT